MSPWLWLLIGLAAVSWLAAWVLCRAAADDHATRARGTDPEISPGGRADE